MSYELNLIFVVPAQSLHEKMERHSYLGYQSHLHFSHLFILIGILHCLLEGPRTHEDLLLILHRLPIMCFLDFMHSFILLHFTNFSKIMKNFGRQYYFPKIKSF